MTRHESSRRSLSRFFVMLLSLSLLTTGANAATEISPGVLYQPGTRLQVSSLGLELTVPDNWQALLPQGSEALVIEPIGQVARLIVTAVPGSSPESVSHMMSQAQALDAMTQLVPSGKLKQKNGIYSQRFEIRGQNPQNLVASAFARLGSNQTALFVVTLEPAQQNLLQKLGRQFLRAASFTTPQAAAQTQAQPGASIDWDRELRGRSLRYLKTDGGLSVDKRMNLCSDGSFYYSDNDSYLSSDAISNFSGYSQSSQAGRWQIAGNQISLSWNDGSQSRFTLSRRYVEEWGEWGTFVDEQRWFNVNNEVCN